MLKLPYLLHHSKLCPRVNYLDYYYISRGFNSGHEDYKKYYEALGLKEGCDQVDVREAFLNLAKKYHPDGGGPDASQETFHKIETAFRKLIKKFSKERHNQSKDEGMYGVYYEQKKQHREKEEAMRQAFMQSQNSEGEEKERGFYDVQIKAPQHRQYLSYEGMGIGSPAQREKQYSKFKVLRATENVIDHKINELMKEYPEASLVAKDKSATKKFKTSLGMERVVEDLIQESMAKGDFENLSLAGKPLKHDSYNPYVDTVTHKLNEVLIDNGYAPEWIILERDIRETKDSIKKKMYKKRSYLGPLPLSNTDQVSWDTFLKLLHDDIKLLNKMIDNYNLVVPILTKQMVHFPLNKISDTCLKEGECKETTNQTDKPTKSTNDATLTKNSNQSIFNILTSIWR